MEPIHIISLGAGVQSSTMALMAAHGEITPMPDAAIFADTQAEPASVYRWLDWLEKQLPFPVERVTAGNLAESAVRVKKSGVTGKTYLETGLPYFTDTDGEAGLNRRGCTLDFKIEPIRRRVRELCGITRGQKEVTVIQWIGISFDEMKRMKPSRDAWCEHRWPLVDIRMRRQGCVEWMRSRGYPDPPRSACRFCPYHNDTEWRRLMTSEPEEFDAAIAYEKRLQQAASEATAVLGTPYLHRSLKPLDTIDFRSDVERGQGTLWDDECEGMCGV